MVHDMADHMEEHQSPDKDDKSMANPTADSGQNASELEQKAEKQDIKTKVTTTGYTKRVKEWTYSEVVEWIMINPKRFGQIHRAVRTEKMDTFKLNGKKLLKTSPGTIARKWDVALGYARNIRKEALLIDKTVKRQEFDSNHSCLKKLRHSKILLIVGLIGQIVLCWTPMFDIITDVITIILYFDSGDSDFGIISSIILIYAFRNQLIFCALIAGGDLENELVNPMSLMCTGIPKIDVFLLIPYIGPSLACSRQLALDDIEDKDIDPKDLPGTACVSFLCVGICSECCMTCMGVCSGPFIVFGVLCARCWINIQTLKTLIKGDVVSVEDEEEHRENKSMFILLKFVEAFTEALPQLGLQTYVFFTRETYNSSNALTLFCFSIALSTISLIKLIYQMVTKWVDILEAMERQLWDAD